MADCATEGNSAIAPTFKFVGFLLGLAAASCYVFVTVTPCWYVIYAEASISPYENCYGLWKFCSSTGLCGKWLSGSLLGSHGAQRTVCRGLMITACLLSGFALILNVMGLKCILLFRLTQRTKEKLTRRAAVVWIVAGTFVLISSTWYGLEVMYSVWEDGKASELSDGIFVGWGGSAFSYAAAALLWIGATLSRKERKEAEKRRDSILSTVAAAYAASRSGSGTSTTCCCHLGPRLAAHECGYHGNQGSNDDKLRTLEPITECQLPSHHARTTYM